MRKGKKRKGKRNYVLTKDIPRASISKANDKLEGGSWSTIRGSMLVAPNFASTYAQAFPPRKVRWRDIVQSFFMKSLIISSSLA